MAKKTATATASLISQISLPLRADVKAYFNAHPDNHIPALLMQIAINTTSAAALVETPAATVTPAPTTTTGAAA